MKNNTKLNLMIVLGVVGWVWMMLLLLVVIHAPGWTWPLTVPALVVIKMGGWAMAEKQHQKLWHPHIKFGGNLPPGTGPVQKRK